IRQTWRLKRFEREREDDFIAELADGYQFRMCALGMGQATRGFTWGTRRPGLVIGDDMEDDEEVMNPDRRATAMRWLFKTLIPLGGDHTLFRIFGTILHQDSLLANLLKLPTWKSAKFSACDAEVSEKSILWPQKFSRER